jgi:alpha/beta superfamily hydrolase
MQSIEVDMDFQNICLTSGHHCLLVNGPQNQIEVVVSVPEQVNTDYFVLIGHPHPLQEGTMDNKVVTTTGRSLLTLQFPVIRFNFRGVGQSGGEFDHGIGETDDMVYLINLWQQAYPHAKLILAGFSFGSYVAFRAAQVVHPQCLILIAPPVHRFTYDLTQLKSLPTVIFQGDIDEVVPADEVARFAKSFDAPIPLEWFQDTGHFFHGKLIQLREAVVKWVQTCL